MGRPIQGVGGGGVYTPLTQSGDRTFMLKHVKVFSKTDTERNFFLSKIIFYTNC